jgi:hypothetical protein
MDQRKPKQNSVKTTQKQQKSSSKKRRERRARARNNINVADGPPQNVYPLPSYSNTGMRALSKMPRKNLTPGGLAFLKCAFAPPDFAASSPTGVPDDYRGPSLLKKHRYVNTFNCSTANSDYYILLAPTAGGIAYWSCVVAAGAGITATSSFAPTYFSDAAGVFGSGPGTEADIVTKYRFVSNHLELIPTVNQMSWTGSIQAWKTPLTMSLRQTGATTANLYTVFGLQGCNSTNANQYTGPINLGVYTAAYNAGSKFDFQDVHEEIPALPTTILPGVDFVQLNGNMAGIDPQFDSVVVKLSGMGSNVLNSFVIKVWSCVEYQVLPGTGLYEYQTLSPCDPYAMEVYRAVILQLPVGVSFLENGDFWKRVLGIIKNISGALSVLPGPYGAISSGVNMMATGIDSLVL